MKRQKLTSSELLCGLCFALCFFAFTQNQYHIGERVFEVPEIKLLVDAVQSARFITAKKSKTLIKKLSLFVGEPQADIPCAVCMTAEHHSVKSGFVRSAEPL